MKKNNKIKKMLSPDCEFKASESLRGRIIDSAKAETVSGHCPTVRFPWRSAFVTCAAALAIFVAVIFKPGSTPLYAAGPLFAKAAEYFSNVSGYSVHFEARTLPSDNFSYINPASKFVEHKMNVCDNGTWSLDKGGRKAVFDGQNVWSCLPEKGFGWKFDASAQSGVLESYSLLLDIEEMMHSLERFASNHPDIEFRKGENEHVYMLVLIMPAQGDYANDYAKYSSILDNKTRQMYVFNKEDGRLMQMKIDAYFLGIPRTIIKLDSIDYDATIVEAEMHIPENIERFDQTKEGIARMEKELPVGEFVGINPEEAVEKLAKAFKNWDEPMLKVILNGYPLSHLKSNGYYGCELTVTGKPFKSGTYKGVFVPCKLKTSSGKIRKVNLALRNDNQWKLWSIDGGL